MKHDRASELRAIADGRLLLNVRNGVTVSRSMLAMIADELDAERAAHAETKRELADYQRATNTVDAHETADMSYKPEGRQEPVAYIKEVLRIFGQGCTNAGPTSPFGGNPADCDECLTAAAMSIRARPSEQAVTEAMVVAAWNDWQTGKQEYGPEAIRAALKAAMEAGG